LGIGQSPIPNPQSPIPKIIYLINNLNNNNNNNYFYNFTKIFKE